MTVVEKAAYLKGLVKGLGIEDDSRDGKLWDALCELVSDIAHEVEDIKSARLDVSESLADIEDQLLALEDAVFCVDDDDYGNITELNRDYCYDDEDDEDGEDDDEELDYDGVMYDVTCPVCGEEITFDEETLSGGSILCPQCGEELEFDVGSDDGDDGDGE